MTGALAKSMSSGRLAREMREVGNNDDRGRTDPPDWDARYRAARGGLYGEAPCEYLRMVAARSDFRPRTALLLGDGDGRNGTWLAGRGIAVTAVEQSGVATRRARARDRRAGVRTRRIAADLACWSPPAGSTFEAVVALYLHCEGDVRRRAFASAIAALAPGGWFVVEAFAKTGDRPVTLGLVHQVLRYDLAELEIVAAELDVIEAFAGRTRLDEGALHRGMAEVVRFAARRNREPA
jgi:SAM-dependent methyltransferase